MKKISILIIALTLIAGLAGCTNQGQHQTDSKNPPTSSQTTDDKSGNETSDNIPDAETEQATATETIVLSTVEPVNTAEEKEMETIPDKSDTSKQNRTAQSSNQTESAKPADTAKPTEPLKIENPKQSESPTVTEPPDITETPQEPVITNPPATTESPKGFTETDHNHIVSEVTAYAESYKSRGFTFEWSDKLEFGWEVGYFGTPRISRDGVDGTIKTLKYHIDRIYQTGTDPANGLTSDSVRYRVVQIEIDGGIAYAVIYG